MVVLIIVLILIVLYLLALSGRTRHHGLQALQGYSYAHRGLHGEGRPENSMAAFRAAVDHGYGIELDVHLLKDGTLAVMHDSALKRTTGAEGFLEDLTKEQLGDYRLEGTEETIPLFSDVLALCEGKSPLIVELKSSNNNYAALAEAACALMKNYRGIYCMESFDPRCILWLKKHRPHIIRGQLAENFLPIKSSVPWILRFLLTYQLGNFLIRPDFSAYKYADRKNLSNFLVRRLWKIQGVSWTLRTPEEYRTAVEEGYLPIFENFIP